MRIAAFILMLLLTSCQSLLPRTGRVAALAADAANARSQKMYGCEPFAASDFAVANLDGGYMCSAIAGYWDGNLRTTVVLGTDLQAQRVEVNELFSARIPEPFVTEPLMQQDINRLRQEIRR
jgi:hypothetical protein